MSRNYKFHDQSKPARNLFSAEDNGGTITYTYHSSGNPSRISALGSTIRMEYDDYGYQEKLIDPDAGTIHYDYNAFGQLSSQTDANTNEFVMEYDKLGRLTKKTCNDGTVTNYNYISSGDGIGNLGSVIKSNNVSLYYAYTKEGRLKTKTEIVDGKSFIVDYGYDSYGNNTLIDHGDFSIKKTYDSDDGFLTSIKRGDNNNAILSSFSYNAMGQPTGYTWGNGMLTDLGYDGHGTIESIKTGSVHELSFNFNTGTGNLQSRTDIKQGFLTESFTYDELDRLKSTSVMGQPGISINYQDNGNITRKTDAGDYTYHDDKEHALVEISNNTGSIPSFNQDVTYNSFNKINTIKENDKEMIFKYGTANERKKVVYKENNSVQETKYYLGSHELEESGGNTRKVYYIGGPDGLAAVYIIENGSGKLYYACKDHLGSIVALVDKNGNVARQNFDAWGRRRNPGNWSYNNVGKINGIDRGYTGHEHMDEFGLINMNGRVYDPVLGRFLSPDNHVQMPDFTQNLNRYSYCLNNPLVHTDPSGEDISLLAIGTVLTFFYLKNAHDNTPKEDQGNPLKWEYNPLNWNPDNTTIVLGGQTNSDGDVTGYIGIETENGMIGGSYNSEHGFGMGDPYNYDFYYPSVNYNAPEQNASKSIATTAINYHQSEQNFQEFKNEYWAKRTKIIVYDPIMTGWEYAFDNTLVAHSVGADINISALFGSGISIGYVNDFYGTGSWYIGSNVNFSDPSLSFNFSSTQIRYTGNTDWKLSFLEGSASFFQGGAGFNKIIHGGFNRTWNNKAGIIGNGIYFGSGISVSPVNGAIGKSFMDLLKIDK